MRTASLYLSRAIPVGFNRAPKDHGFDFWPQPLAFVRTGWNPFGPIYTFLSASFWM